MIAAFATLATLRAQRRQLLAPGTLFALAIMMLAIAGSSPTSSSKRHSWPGR